MCAAQNVYNMELVIYRIAYPKERARLQDVRTQRINEIVRSVAMRTARVRRLGLEDPLIDTHVTALGGDEILILAEYCFTKGDFDNIRVGVHLFLGIACVLRSINIELLGLNYLYSSRLGDSSLRGLKIIPVFCALIDRSKTNQFGKKFVTGCCHHLEVIRCPIFWTSLMLLLRFLPVERGGIGGSYPQLNDPRSWYDTPLLVRSDQPNSRTPLTPDSTLKELKLVLTACLCLNAEEILFAKKRHGMRHSAVGLLESGGVEPEEQCSLGNWSSDRRSVFYAWSKLSRKAVLTMGGSPRNEAGVQDHRVTWRGVNPSDDFKAKVLPVAAEWNHAMQDANNPVWTGYSGGEYKPPTACAKAFNKVTTA